ncbi:Tyrosine-protein phosphatase non-receptor type 14 [Collichthys lucidus]|uniref:Tyrosine-protein phosphatase non-receptor type 14 n=1 Tax=Collichthys lucidus TaxID=240159 RepID=A0A4U5UNM1_COLLU|nr:Tyrosine-protein phosphatase non-receptor type 14 [Collichthys lucidus]
MYKHHRVTIEPQNENQPLSTSTFPRDPIRRALGKHGESVKTTVHNHLKGFVSPRGSSPPDRIKLLPLLLLLRCSHGGWGWLIRGLPRERNGSLANGCNDRNWPNGEEVLEDWTQKVAEEHKSHCGMQIAEAELLYIKEDNYTNDIFIGVSFIGVFVKHRNGRSIMLHKWKDIGTIAHNKSAITAHSLTCTDQEETHLEPPPISDSIFHDDQYYKSETSLDRCPVDFPFRNGTVPNGSMYSSPSLSSLNHSQTFVPPSPMSSNLSIPGSELMRPDYIPSHRHSAIIAPSYRPTPEYDAVMRQKRRMLPAHHDLHSQSLRSLNISNACAYRQPEALVYSQPEMRERGPYHGLGPRPGTVHTTVTVSLCHMDLIREDQPATRALVIHPALMEAEAVAGLELLPPGNQHPGPGKPPSPLHRGQQSRVGHPHGAAVGQDLPTGQLGLWCTSPCRSPSPFLSPKLLSHNPSPSPSLSLSLQPPPPPQQSQELPKQIPAQKSPEASVAQTGPVAYQHQKTFSNATMVIHSSESEEEEEEEEERPELDVQIPGLNEDISISAQLQAALAKLPNKPPPEYPGPPRPPSNAQIRTHTHNHNHTHHHNHNQGPQNNQGPMDSNQAQGRAPKTGQSPNGPGGGGSGSGGSGAGSGGGGGGGGTLTRGDQSGVNGAVLGPSISEPDLTSVKERVRKEPVKERPVSEMFSLEDSIVEREIAQRTLERQKMSVDSMKRPLMMAALNGLYVARMPVPESPAEDGAKAATDERCKTLELKLEEERVFTEYEQVPKKRADCVLTTATLPENTERNRFRDVVPYEENRVELVPNKENNTGYINASHIKVMIRGEEWHYIATQGPLANTCADFWQMVWEQGVNVIAMVTAEEEGGRSKSHRYWPKLGSKHNSATHGKFKVTTKFRTDSGCYATTGLKVKHLLSGQERTVWHLQYTDWPEQGCPEYVQGFLSYLEEIQSVRRHTNSMLDTSKSLNPPVVVHCSAGVGRTGVVILTELMISCLEHNEPVEVPAMLSGLRQQRMLMVQTISQYKFVYQVLIQFLKNSRLI